MKSKLLLVGLLLSCFVANAQLEKIIHKTFEVDEVENVNFNIVGEYEIEQWSGNLIMTETKIELYEASKGILDHFVKAGRYELEISGEEGEIEINSKDQERKAIRTKKGECFEIVKIKIFVPEDFTIASPTRIFRHLPKEE